MSSIYDPIQELTAAGKAVIDESFSALCQQLGPDDTTGDEAVEQRPDWANRASLVLLGTITATGNESCYATHTLGTSTVRERAGEAPSRGGFDADR